MYLIHKVIIISCLRDPKSSMELKSGFEIEVFKFLYSVDSLAQLGIF
jgi:hypothetical protein